MEDQQSGAGDLTDETRDDEAPTEATVETERGETTQAAPQRPRGRHKMPRGRALYKAQPTPPRSGTSNEAVDAQPDPVASDESDSATVQSVTSSDDAAVQTADDGDQTAPEPAGGDSEAAVEQVDAGADSVEDGETAVTDAVEPGDEAVQARKPVRRRLAVAVLTAAALFVGSAAFAGATVQPYLNDRATVATKLTIARMAAKAVTTLWSYTPENLDKLGDRASAYLSGDFEAQYRKFVDALVAPNKQAQVTNSTVVTGAAVESVEGPNAVAIVYTNTTSTSPLTKNIPSLRYLSYRLFMKRDRSRWLVTRMTTITSLDLTPRL